MFIAPKFSRRLERMLREPARRAPCLRDKGIIVSFQFHTAGDDPLFTPDFVREWNAAASFEFSVWVQGPRPDKGTGYSFASIAEVEEYIATGRKPPKRDNEELVKARHAAQFTNTNTEREGE